jgi:hypothetical protein
VGEQLLDPLDFRILEHHRRRIALYLCSLRRDPAVEADEAKRGQKGKK